MASITCTNCGAVLKTQNPIAPGKKVKCPKCSEAFVVQAEEPEPEIPKKKKPVPEPEPEDDEDGGAFKNMDDAVDESPKPKKRGKTSAEDDEDADEDAEDGDEKPAKKKKSNKTLYIILGVVASLLLCCMCGGGFGFYVVSQPEFKENFDKGMQQELERQKKAQPQQKIKDKK